MRASFFPALLLAFLAAPAWGYSTLTSETTSELGFEQHPGAQLPLDAVFRDSDGRLVRLGSFFGGKPVLLVLDYLRCRSLCGFVLQDTAAALARLPLRPGRDYEVVSISIDPRDTPDDARIQKAKYTERFGDAAGWHFLTGAQADIDAVAGTVGFPARYDAAIDQYAHPAGITVATPQAVISRYILGVGYRPLDLRLALTEASGGNISSPVTDVLLLCYCYDPGTGRYSFAIQNATRALCGLTVLGLLLMLRRLARQRRG